MTPQKRRNFVFRGKGVEVRIRILEYLLYNTVWKKLGRSQSLTIVIKLGTSSIVDERTHEPILSILSVIVETVAKLRNDGHRVILVSSGAVGVGLRRMDIDERPKHLPRIQALAAVGQCRLMSLWDSLFGHLRIPVAQILLTRSDIADTTQYTNAQNTFSELLDMGVLPVVNENDTLAVAEIKFGDNDTLSAITAAMVKADYLFLMTDVDCLYTANPRHDADAQPIEVVSDISTLEADVSTSGSSLGTGGMGTKIVAARLATSAGVTTVITKSSKPGNVHEIVRYLQESQSGVPVFTHKTEEALTATSYSGPLIPPLHTRFLPSITPIQSRSFWVLHGLSPHGNLYIDQGALSALQNKASLLPAGVVAVEGHFGQQEAVRLFVVEKRAETALDGDFVSHAQEPKEIGRAIVNYGSLEIDRIKGIRSTHIRAVLGYADSEYVALRENISFFPKSEVPSRAVTPGLADRI